MNDDQEWRGLCRAGGVAAMILIVYSIATMLQLLTLGGQPASAAEAFALLQRNPILGLLRLDLPTVLAMPLYYLLFLGIFAALRRAAPAAVTIATLLAFAGVTLILATPTALSMLPLSEKFAGATTDAARQLTLLVGEALMATDIWHATSAMMGAWLLQIGAVIVSVVMLRGNVFSKATAWMGILTHGLDLAHMIIGLFAPTAGVILMAIAGPLYLIWFPLVGRRLLQLGRVQGFSAMRND
jgi:hypothetical protein